MVDKAKDNFLRVRSTPFAEKSRPVNMVSDVSPLCPSPLPI